MKLKTIIAAVMLALAATGAVAADNNDGKKLKYTIFGDSYSTFEGYLTPDTNEVWYFKPENPKHYSKNDVTRVEETWWHQLIDEMGGELELNNSYSGSTICYTGYKKDKVYNGDYQHRAFVTRDNKLGNPDVILICGATNDSWAGAPIGDYTYGNWTREDLYSFRPAMAKLLADLKTNYPEAKLLFILNSELKESINESVHTICRHYGVKCLDLQNVDKQAGHPSIAGMKSIAQQVKETLKKEFGIKPSKK